MSGLLISNDGSGDVVLLFNSRQYDDVGFRVFGPTFGRPVAKHVRTERELVEEPAVELRID